MKDEARHRGRSAEYVDIMKIKSELAVKADTYVDPPLKVDHLDSKLGVLSE